ncbi:hypothetical protein HN709_00040 [Candidatus Peregrinibacteria bacterium]|jgi:hypothetical protein|nr:hypothetical protein [Candidatus Peregrinibacteria bacterium]MBT7736062.1 hypothetical protein [Candidatus Peregrinibacteria bacterium]
MQIETTQKEEQLLERLRKAEKNVHQAVSDIIKSTQVGLARVRTKKGIQRILERSSTAMKEVFQDCSYDIATIYLYKVDEIILRMTRLRLHQLGLLNAAST